jgi:hypothetical protein
MKWCWLELYIPKTMIFKSFDFTCEMNSTCYLIQEGFKWTVMETVNVDGEHLADLNMNVEDLTA